MPRIENADLKIAIQPDQKLLSPAARFPQYQLVSIVHLLRLTPFWLKMPYLAYVFLSAVLFFQCFAAFMGVMHASSYWCALIINCMFALLANFVFYPIYALSNKYAQKKNTAS